MSTKVVPQEEDRLLWNAAGKMNFRKATDSFSFHYLPQ